MSVELGPTGFEGAPAGLYRLGALDKLPGGRPANIFSGFGKRDPIWTPGGWSGPFHHGWDIDYPVYSFVGAWSYGLVVKANNADDGTGYMLQVMPTDDLLWEFLHLAEPATDYATGNDLVPGDYVTRGQLVGRVGSTGLSTGPHLHAALWSRFRGNIGECQLRVQQAGQGNAPRQWGGPDEWEVWIALDPTFYVRNRISIPPYSTNPLSREELAAFLADPANTAVTVRVAPDLAGAETYRAAILRTAP